MGWKTGQDIREVNYHRGEKQGGLKMIDFNIMNKALKVAWKHVYNPGLTHSGKSSLKLHLKIFEEYHFFHNATTTSGSCNLKTSQTSFATS